jgi:phage-related baseplate assembly protein
MERAGKATLRALKLAVQAVEGVSGEVIVIDQPDGVPGLIQVIASGGDREEIEWAIEETRSAGIKVEFKRPVTLSLDLNVTIVLAPGADQEGTKQAVDTAIMDYMGTLEIGDDVIVSRIIEAAVGVEGVKDAREVVINGKPDNVLVKETEKGACRVLEIVVRE